MGVSTCYVPLICTLCVSTLALTNPFVIQSMGDFWTMYDTAQSASFSFDVDLRCDLHFSNHERQMERPLGQGFDKIKIPNAYNGVFEGNNHTIFGLNMTLPYQPSSDAAFFGLLGNATIRNLRFDPSCVFDGAWSGSLAVKTHSKSSVVIENVHSSATVRSGGTAGGLIAYVGSLDITFESCSNNGDISVTTQPDIKIQGVGGIAGQLNNQNTTIRDCHNNGTINVKMSTSDSMKESLHTSGIIGAAYLYSSPQLTVKSCTNSGNITITVGDATKDFPKNVSASGIVSFSRMSFGDFIIHKCHNNGTISVTSKTEGMELYGSGIASIIVDAEQTDMVVNVTECSNHGIITTSGTSTNTFSSGIVSSNSMTNLSLVSCMNRGFVTSTNQSCGLASYASSVENSVNTGFVNGSYSYGLVKEGISACCSVSMGDLQSVFSSYPIAYSSKRSRYLFYRQGISAGIPRHGYLLILNNSWVAPDLNNKDIVDYLNFIVGEQKYTMWWTSNLTLGHQIRFNGTSIPESLKTTIVAEHDETIRSAIKREGPQELLSQNMYLMDAGLDDHVTSYVTIFVKKVHQLSFSGAVNETTIIHIVDGEVLTAKQLEPIQEFLNNIKFLIVDDNGRHFNASEPVICDRQFTIKKAKLIEVIVDCPVDDDDIKDVISIISKDNVAVRVIASEDEDGTTRLVIVVDDDHSDDVLDFLVSCNSP